MQLLTLNNWSTRENGLAVDTSNAVLAIDERERQEDNIILELFNPIYDRDR